MEDPMPTVKATEASSQATGNPTSSTTSSLNAITKATRITNDANSVFALFPNLPLELRLKIWKHTLPGPRVVPIYTRDMRKGGHRAVSKRYASLNSFIKITTVCHEARTVVMETYDQFPNVVWPFSDVDPTDHERDAFVYINYNIDTVYVEDRTRTNLLTAPRPGKVQHLAYELNQPRAFREWAKLKRDCPRLKSLTFIDPRTRFGHKHDEEWRLVDVPADFGPAVTLPQLDEHGHYIEEQLAKVLEDHGNLALFGAEAKETLGYFKEHVKDLAEWKDVSLKIAIVAQRKIDSLAWMLVYPVWDLVPNIYKSVHWHEEPVLLGDGAVTSSRPNPHPNRHCHDCRIRRWLCSNDAFWLSRVRKKRITGAEDHMIHGQDQLKM